MPEVQPATAEKLPGPVISKTASAVGLSASVASLVPFVTTVAGTPAGIVQLTLPATTGCCACPRQYTSVPVVRLSVKPVGKCVASPGTVPQPTLAFSSCAE